MLLTPKGKKLRMMLKSKKKLIKTMKNPEDMVNEYKNVKRKL